MFSVKGFIGVMLSLVLLTTGCATDKKDAVTNTGEAAPTSKQQAPATKTETKGTETEKKADLINTSYKVSKGSYSVDDPIMTVKINYPQITNLGDINRQIAINEILKNKALSYAKYKVEPELFTDKYKGSPDRYWAQVDYEIKWQSENVVSFLYKGSRHFPRRPHPNHHRDGINIDIKKAKIIVLPELVEIDDTFGFAEKFQAGKIKSVRPWLVGHVFFSNDPETKKKGYVLDDAFLVDWFSKPYNHFYLTKDSLGLAVPVIFALGDEVEFEIRYEDMGKHIKHENELWRDFLPEAGKQ